MANFILMVFEGLQQRKKIVLLCARRITPKSEIHCNTTAYITPFDNLKQIIQKKPQELHAKKNSYSKFFDKSDPEVFDIKNYDINTLEIAEAHKCLGTEQIIRNTPKNTPKIHSNVSVEKSEKLKCKLLKITNHGGIPRFHFENNEKVYFYRIRGIKADDKIILHCITKNCAHNSTVLPSEVLKQIIQKSPEISLYAKILDKSDPKVYDIENYDLNLFDKGEGHKCKGAELSVYLETISMKENTKVKLIKVEKSRGYPQFHFEINGKLYSNSVRGITADNKISLRCRKSINSTESQKCLYICSIRPFDTLKESIHYKPNELQNKRQRFPKNFNKSDPKVYDINNYDIDSLEFTGVHKCPGTTLDD